MAMEQSVRYRCAHPPTPQPALPLLLCPAYDGVNCSAYTASEASVETPHSAAHHDNMTLDKLELVTTVNDTTAVHYSKPYVRHSQYIGVSKTLKWHAHMVPHIENS